MRRRFRTVPMALLALTALGADDARAETLAGALACAVVRLALAGCEVPEIASLTATR